MTNGELKTREAAAIEARETLLKTLHELQLRLSPKSIAADVKDKAKEKADGAISAAKEGVVQAATHPSTVAAIAVPIAMYFFRKPIARTVSALLGHSDADQPAPRLNEAGREAPLASIKSIRASRRDKAKQ